MAGHAVVRDERTVAIENASYRVAYFALSYALLGVVAYRAFVLQQANWDLMLLVVASGVTTTVYQASRRVLSSRWAIATAGTVAGAAVVAAVIAVASKAR